ncbi:prolyl 4-hydroxylase subunit alpha-1-like [Tubulanus polymorphus]|uniref:prolyl 4-hydroxylase subunit alpha-1-like n=1 Tax=Tubulanus polymorphus TaxID=672921 RepID=UPI003DA5EE89
MDKCLLRIRTSNGLSRHRCFYQDTRIPYYKAKIERLSTDPEVLLYHDVISDEEIEQVQKLAGPQFEQSTVRQGTNIHVDVDYRISQTAWLADSGLIAKLSNRIMLVTGLSVALSPGIPHAEPLQVVNYGIGGLFTPHHDFFDTGGETRFFGGSGNRMATWMFYLNDVTAGGATVFTDIDLYVPATKGAAAFWYDLFDDGTPDFSTTHGGCPILMGTKWVANKWIHEAGQMFRRPCKD